MPGSDRKRFFSGEFVPSAIWLLRYDIESDARERYLAWFHDVHIPEKLARPGYTWAAHYEGPPAEARSNASSDAAPDSSVSSGFVALFGGDATRVFLDPSPAQLKPRQDALTREMMGLRQHAFGLILAHEWSTPGPGPIVSPGLGLCFLSGSETSGANGNVPVNDESIGAWAVQALLPGVEASGDDVRIGKWVSATVQPRHVITLEMSRDQNPASGDFTDRALAGHPAIAGALMQWAGHRIWPASD